MQKPTNDLKWNLSRGNYWFKIEVDRLQQLKAARTIRFHLVSIWVNIWINRHKAITFIESLKTLKLLCL